MTTLVFTICARNYIGLAQVLASSVAAHGADVDFRIYVAEGVSESDGQIVSAPEALAPWFDAPEFRNMAFMYNVTEFCTALKAACFLHGFESGYDRCLYMDPDIFVTADLRHILNALDDSSILITPHLCLPAQGDGPRPDHGILATGVYNLGFLGLRRSEHSLRFLGWWHERLRRQAFNDHYHALYTDQRWIDFVPSLFPAESVKVWRHLGCNVAPWNYHERRILRDGDGFAVRPRDPAAPQQGAGPLIFLHFSGFDFRRILDGEFNQLNLTHSETHNDLLPLYEHYGVAIRAQAEDMARHLAQPYGFERFADGSMILPSHRRLFRVWRDRHGYAEDPFAVGPRTFHAALAARRLLARDAKGDLAADKANASNVGNAEGLLRRARAAFRLAFRLLGRSRFFILVRGLNKLSSVEQHYDTFDLDHADIRPAGRQTMRPHR